MSDWTQVQVQQARLNPARYDHLTVVSNSIQSLWHPLRVGSKGSRGL